MDELQDLKVNQRREIAQKIKEAREMLLVDEVDNREFLTGLFHAMYDELPAPKPKKKK